jgi:hypothetical protein
MLSLLLALVCQSAAVQPQSQQVAWTRQYVSGYSPAFDIPYAIAVDPAGNVHVTGGSYGPDQLPDVATIKYGTGGATKWVRRHNGLGNSWDQGLALALDDAGNVYVTGRTYSASTYFDYVTIKYDAAGVEQWVARYDGPSGNDDSAVSIAVDAAGNVYVAGTSWQSGTSYDYATIKYDGSGQQQWVARFNGPGNTNDQAVALALDAAGNVYVTGSSGEGSPNLSDYVTVKYDPSGAEMWVARYSDWYDYVAAITVDAASNVYVTGRSYHPGTYYDYATVKYDANGAQKWAARYHGTGGSDDEARAVKVDAAGNVYVTGESVGPGTGGDYATIKYSASGAVQWVRRYDGPGSATDAAVALALDDSGHVYVTGESEGAAGTVTDIATIKYTPAGDVRWLSRHNGAGNTFDHGMAIAVDSLRGVYVTGRSNQLGGSRFTTMKLWR